MVSARPNASACRETYLALVFVGVYKLCAIACDFVLRRAGVLLGSIQCDLNVLDVRVEDCVEITWQCGADNLELLCPFCRH